MKNIVFIAPPSAGKGTQSDLLVKNLGYEHISTGDLFRAEVASGSELGQELDREMKLGNLISDDITARLLKTKLSSSDKPFVLDGFPRNLSQAENLNSYLEEVGKKVEVAIFLDISENEAMRRACGRATCPDCNFIYQIYDECLKPKVDGICDHCSAEIATRSDDNEETFKKRFQTYMDNTAPLLDFYEKEGLLARVPIKDDSTPEVTFEKIKEIIL